MFQFAAFPDFVETPAEGETAKTGSHTPVESRTLSGGGAMAGFTRMGIRPNEATASLRIRSDDFIQNGQTLKQPSPGGHFHELSAKTTEPAGTAYIGEPKIPVSTCILGTRLDGSIGVGLSPDVLTHAVTDWLPGFACGATGASGNVVAYGYAGRQHVKAWHYGVPQMVMHCPSGVDPLAEWCDCDVDGDDDPMPFRPIWARRFAFPASRPRYRRSGVNFVVVSVHMQRQQEMPTSNKGNT